MYSSFVFIKDYEEYKLYLDKLKTERCCHIEGEPLAYPCLLSARLKINDTYRCKWELGFLYKENIENMMKKFV